MHEANKRGKQISNHCKSNGPNKMKMRKNLIAYVIIFTLRVNHNPTLEAKEILDESR